MARVFHTTRAFSVDPDMWWHLKSGETILQTHRWPTTDPYSFTVSGQSWMAAEWLGDLIFAGVARLGGVRALDLLLIGLGTAVVLALYVFATLRVNNSKAGFVAAALLCALAIASFNLRPQMFGYLFLILTLIALERFRQGHSRALWILPPLFLIWINTHGSWIIGLGALFVFWIGGVIKMRLGDLESESWSSENRLRIAYVFLLCLMTLFMTPYGTRLAMYPFDVASKLPVSFASIMEWQPLAFNLLGGKIFLGIVIAIVMVQAAFRIRWRLEEFMLFLFGTVAACLHTRFLLLFVPFTAPLLAVVSSRWLTRYDRTKDRFGLNALLILGVVGGIVYYFPSSSYVQQKISERFPVEALEFLSQHDIPGPVYNSYFFGGYLVWARGPEHKVFIDGRSELYERGGVLSDYLTIADVKPTALAILQLYRVESCLIQRDATLGTLLSASADWERVYADSVSAIYVRRDALNRQRVE